MFTKKIPFHDLHGKPRNATVYFNLFEVETIKLYREFNTVLGWRDSLMEEEEERVLDPEEMLMFYNALEEILLSAYGVPGEDGISFDHDGRYDFAKTTLFNKCMIEFVTNPEFANEFIDQVMPKGLEDILRTSQENLDKIANETDNKALKDEIVRLKARLDSTTPKAVEAS